MKSLTLWTGSRDVFLRTVQQKTRSTYLVFNDGLLDSNEEIYAYMLSNFLAHGISDCQMFTLSHHPFEFMWVLLRIHELPAKLKETKRKYVRKLFKKEALTDKECDQILKVKLAAKGWNGKRWINISTLDPGDEDDFKSEWGGVTSLASYGGKLVCELVNIKDNA